MVEEQGQKILGSLITQTKNELDTFLNEPKRVNKLYASLIASQEYYNNKDVSDVQNLTYDFFNKLKTDLPQISVLSYGDENKNFVGLRSNDNTDDFSLLLPK